MILLRPKVTMTSIAAYTVNWNNADDTIMCINSLLSCEIPLDVFVVDNASTDDSLAIISSKFPNLEIIESATNLGYSGGANLAFKKIISKGYRRILSINNDAILSEGTISRLNQELERDESIGLISPWIVYSESDEIWFAGGRYFSWVGMTMHEKKGKVLPTPRDDFAIDSGYVCGCCVLYRSELIADVGMFDEDLFMYSEDLEHSLNSVRNGWRICTLPSVVVEHKVSSSSGSDQTKHFSKFRSYYYARNPILIIRKSPPSIKKLVSLISQLVIVLPYSVLRMISEGTLEALPNFLRGIFDGYMGRTGPVVLAEENS
mgnify:CR=1 FL=1